MSSKPWIEYTNEIGVHICRLIRSTDRGMGGICKENPDIPCRATIFEWIATIPEFREMYVKAKQDQVESMVNTILDISDECREDSAAAVAKAKLQVDTRKWLAGKLVPRLYGDKYKADDIPSVNDLTEEQKAEVVEIKKAYQRPE